MRSRQARTLPRITGFENGNGVNKQANGSVPTVFNKFILAVLALLFGALWSAKLQGLPARTGLRRKRDEGAPRLEVIDRLPLTQHHSLHLVRLADRTMLIGLSPNGCNLLESAQIALPSAVRQES